MRFKDKVVIITGAGSGIGRATALLFAKEGAKVVVCDIDVKGGLETIEFINEGGGEATFVQTDVTSELEVENLIKATVEKYGGLDVLFNNVGIDPETAYGVTAIDVSEKTWDKIINVNLKGIFLCSKHAIPEMKKGGGGVIINTASTAGLEGYRGNLPYGVSKYGVVGITKLMALDHGPDNIRVNCICPGATLTPMIFQFNTEERLKLMIREYPLGRLGRPEDQAYAVSWLASDEASWVTGVALPVDGGVTAGKFYEPMKRLKQGGLPTQDETR